MFSFGFCAKQCVCTLCCWRKSVRSAAFLPSTCPENVLLSLFTLFLRGIPYNATAHCVQVPARAHGHRVLWEEVVHSEPALEPPDATLQPPATRHIAPGLHGPRDRGEEPGFPDEEDVRGNPILFLGNHSLQTIHSCGVNVFLGFTYRLSIPRLNSRAN